MAETFLDLIETIEAHELADPALSTEQLYTRDEPEFNVPITFGRRKRDHRNDPRYRRALLECVRLIDRVRAGSLPDLWLREAMSTSDFSLLFGDVLDRQMLGAYREAPAVWRAFMKVGTVRDFRAASRYYVDGGEGALPEVKELGEYKARKLTPGKYSITAKKYGARMPFSWEMFVNDDLGAITDTPVRFARAARRSESRFATGLYVGASGPLSTLYTSGNKNQIITANGASANNPPLSIAGLSDGLLVLSNMKDSDNEPITIEAVVLAVPPALEITALNMINSTQLWTTTAGGASNQQIVVNNWMKNRVSVAVDPYIPLIATSNGNTSWFLFASANEPRPALEFDFLRGFEQPQIFMKSPNAVRVGSGLIDPMLGDFDHDLIDYKIRHVFAGAPLDPHATVASNGSGS